MSEKLELQRVEYRVVPISRYIVTRYEEWNLPPDGVSDQAADRRVVEQGEYATHDLAWEVAYALAKQRHDLLGWPLDDERIQYPRHIYSGGAKRVAEIARPNGSIPTAL
jgi:hypothetical protein